MTKRNILLLAMAVSLIGSALVVDPALAACAGADTSVITCNGEGGAALVDIVGQVIKIMTVLGGVLAVGAVVVGAILYSASGNNPQNMQKAKSIWMNTAIGLTLFGFFVAITNFLIPGGVF